MGAAASFEITTSRVNGGAAQPPQAIATKSASPRLNARAIGCVGAPTGRAVAAAEAGQRNVGDLDIGTLQYWARRSAAVALMGELILSKPF